MADALELLNKTFTSGEVRAYAVSRLDTAEDDELLLYLLQVTTITRSARATIF